MHARRKLPRRLDRGKLRLPPLRAPLPACFGVGTATAQPNLAQDLSNKTGGPFTSASEMARHPAARPSSSRRSRSAPSGTWPSMVRTAGARATAFGPVRSVWWSCLKAPSPGSPRVPSAGLGYKLVEGLGLKRALVVGNEPDIGRARPPDPGFDSLAEMAVSWLVPPVAASLAIAGWQTTCRARPSPVRRALGLWKPGRRGSRAAALGRSAPNPRADALGPAQAADSRVTPPRTVLPAVARPGRHPPASGPAALQGRPAGRAWTGRPCRAFLRAKDLQSP